jgi:hypothetical protein
MIHRAGPKYAVRLVRSEEQLLPSEKDKLSTPSVAESPAPVKVSPPND